MKYRGRGDEGGGSPGCCDPLLLLLLLPQSTGSSGGEINRSQRGEDVTPSPPPLAICPSSPSPLFHGEELSRCRLRGSRGWDGMELRQIGQSKVSLGAQTMLLWMHRGAGSGDNNGTSSARTSAFSRGCGMLPHCDHLPHMHGVRWKVIGGMETVHGGKPGGWVDAS